jgi:hypothetical protein
LFRQPILSLLWQREAPKNKKDGPSGKQKVLKFYLSFLSTRLLELSWVEYYDPVVLNSTQLNPPLYSTQLKVIRWGPGLWETYNTLTSFPCLFSSAFCLSVAWWVLI